MFTYVIDIIGLVVVPLCVLAAMLAALCDHRNAWLVRLLDAGVLLVALVLWFALWYATPGVLS